MAVEVVGGAEILQRDGRRRSEQARFGAQHETTSMGRLRSRGGGIPAGVRAIYRGEYSRTRPQCLAPHGVRC